MIDVYQITCAATGKHYIGISSKGGKRRFKTHIYNALSGRPGVLYAAIRKHGAESFSFEVIACAVSHDDATHLERAIIADRETMTPNGYNMTEGGEGVCGLEVSEATRARMSKAHKARQANPELRARTSAALTGKQKALDHVQKVAEALRGKSLSAETRAKIAATLTGHKQSEETIERRALKLRGKKKPEWIARRLGDLTRGVPKTEEHKSKLSEALKGRALSAEQRAKISAATRGKPKSEEWKAKARAGWARRRAERANAA